jgi:hypothetical protein
MEPESSFLSFVQDQISEMKEAARLGTDKEISFFELEHALKGYSHVYISLLSLYNIARIDLQKEKEKYNAWYSAKYIAVRGEVNKPELTAQKWASTKEIEHMVIALNPEEYQNQRNQYLEKESKLDFLSGLIDMWKSHQFILSTLSSNIRAEAGMNQ